MGGAAFDWTVSVTLSVPALSLPFTWLARSEKTVQDEITATDVED